MSRTGRPKRFGSVHADVWRGVETSLRFSDEEAIKLAHFILTAAQSGKPSIELWAHRRVNKDGLLTVSIEARDLRVEDDREVPD